MQIMVTISLSVLLVYLIIHLILQGQVITHDHKFSQLGHSYEV